MVYAYQRGQKNKAVGKMARRTSEFKAGVEMKGRSAKRRSVVIALFGFIALAVLALAPRGAAQDGCLKGNVMLAMGVNGKVELCPSAAAKAPDLQKRLDDLQKSIGGNQELLRELARSARSVNALGRNVDPQRQAELLHSFDHELETLMKSNQKEVLQQTAKLADKLDNLQDMVAQSREDQQTAVQTMKALNGQLGDAIAALDTKQAEQQLQAIQANLNKIAENTERTNKILERQAAREEAADERQKKEAEALDSDPNMYTRAQIMSLNSDPKRKVLHYMIFMYSRPPLYPPFIDSTMSIAFHKGTEAWRIDAGDKQVNGGGELWHVHFDEVGDSATLCFVAHDKPSGRLREWTQRYKITPSTSGIGVNFVPEGDASMRLTNGGPCDGVTNVRQVSAAAETPPTPGRSPEAEALQRQTQQMLAQQQEQIEALRQRGSQARIFATIRAEGSRRDNMNGSQWVIEVKTQPFRPGTTLYDEQVEANLIDASNRATPLQLGGRKLFVNIESRYAFVDHMGTKAVVCLTAKDPAGDKTLRLTQWFNIETSRVYWNDGGARNPGDQATFIPSKPATLSEASSTPCQ
jgi:hypothetical protein